MGITLKDNCRWDLVVPTSMGVRITPENGQPVHCSDRFFMQATSAETNVATIPASLGLKVKVLTKFVKDSPVASFIKSSLKNRGMEFEAIEVEQGGPWGYRHQFNIADSGHGARGPRVHNDRAGEIGRTLCLEEFDIENLFANEGVKLIHMSGLIAALSPTTSNFCLELAKTAKKHGTLISFDLNHRASFWEGREQELRETFTGIASTADILVGNEEDFQLCLGVEGPEAGGKDISVKIESFKEMISRVKEKFPNTSVFGTTLREVVSANEHLWGSILHAGGKWHLAEPRLIGVLDRVGGGDGYVGGLLHGILKNWHPEKWNQFGWATGALATTFLTDYAQPADEEMVWSVWKGNARIKR